MKIRKKLLFLVSLFMCSSFFSYSKNPTINDATIASSTAKVLKQKEEDSDVVFTYLDVLNQYYEKALDVKTEEEKDFISFQDFSDTYYTYGKTMGIVSYTDAWNNYDTVEEFTSAFSKPVLRDSSSSSSSGDANYILNSSTYFHTPARIFKRQPVNTFGLIVSIQKGDIVYETNTKFWDAGHDAMVVNLAQPSDYGNFYETIEAVGGGVQYGFLDDQRIIDFGVILLRPRATQAQIDKAIYFISLQLGKTYNLNIYRSNTSIDSKEWYCSELVWASYFYGGLDICQIDNIHHGQPGNLSPLLPVKIYNSDNTYEISLANFFLKISIVSYKGASWKIRIKSPFNYRAFVRYNKKMCYEGDAQNWTNLVDQAFIDLSSFAYTDVYISKNWFADSIVCCTDDNGYHFITYANQLDSLTKKMMIKHSVKSIFIPVKG